jgi:ADP-dependent NAD(P)H-hydrate dehydratase / NAD(P)H-hydrate epimerase
MDPGLPLYRCDDVREIDRAAIEQDGIAAWELMTRAARASLQLLRQAWPQAHRIALYCGPGNNGGDGYVLARLAHEAGLAPRVVALDPAVATTPEARRAQHEWRVLELGIDAFDPHAPLPAADVVVDALFGIGFKRSPREAAAQAIEAINRAGAPVLALDVPSGLDADCGSVPGVAVHATRTLSFIAPKLGLYTGIARELCGLVDVASLEVSERTRATRSPAAHALRVEHLRHWLAPRPRHAHKGRHGRVLALGGDHGYGGAIRLCAEAALRCGAGLVSVATRATHVAAILAARPEAMVHAVEDGEALALALRDAEVIALGPGLGQGEWGRESMRQALQSARPCVIDADALNLLARLPQPLPDAVLTPHPGEAARLLGVDVAAIEQDRYAAALALAQRFQCAVVLKGAGSIVAAPGRIPALIDAGNPGMASGGMGDALTGAIAALRAQGLDAFDAARAGALLHAAAGDAAARALGERGLLASDLFPHLHALANPA